MTNYKSPALTVDAIIEEKESILMIRRKSNTFNGYFALPGGFVEYGESAEEAVRREVLEELNLHIEPLHILGVYSESDRDPRGHVVSTIFICTFKGTPMAGDDAQSYEWLLLNDIEKNKIAFDHKKILKDYKSWKVNRGTFWSTKT